MKILLVEDELELAKSIAEYLHLENNVVEVANTFDQADEKIELYQYDVILVDITLPDGSGLNVIKNLKETQSNAGVIIISAKNSLEDKIAGLDLGADDYLSKPFHLSELNARIKALERRKKYDGRKEIVINEITIFPDDKNVFIHKNEIFLTLKEYELLMYFVANKNKVVSKNAVAEHIWGDNSDNLDNYDFIYSHIKNLRKKLIEKGCKDYLTTIYGMGYNFKTE